MGLLSKKVPYSHGNFLLYACQFTASSQGNGKFTEFVHLHGADSIAQKSPKFYLLTHYFTYLPKFFSPIRFFAHLPKFSTTKVFRYTVSQSQCMLIIKHVLYNKLKMLPLNLRLLIVEEIISYFFYKLCLYMFH